MMLVILLRLSALAPSSRMKPMTVGLRPGPFVISSCCSSWLLPSWKGPQWGAEAAAVRWNQVSFPWPLPGSQQLESGRSEAEPGAVDVSFSRQPRIFGPATAWSCYPCVRRWASDLVYCKGAPWQGKQIGQGTEHKFRKFWKFSLKGLRLLAAGPGLLGQSWTKQVTTWCPPHLTKMRLLTRQPANNSGQGWGEIPAAVWRNTKKLHRHHQVSYSVLPCLLHTRHLTKHFMQIIMDS